MTVREFYDKVGGSYEDVMERLLSEQRVKKYLFKLSGTGDYEGALESLENENWQDFFRFTHSLKGVGLNLGLSSLASAAAETCDLVRNGPPPVSPRPGMDRISKIYKNIIAEIEVLKAEDQA